jgi:class III poly(R)-hydroxyalkanoic acid synthase PhaE subunit
MTEPQNPLYETWLETLPGFFRALMPPGVVPTDVFSHAGDAAPASPLPFPVDQVARALGVMNGMLTQLYQSYLPLLAQGGFNAERLQHLVTATTEGVNRLRESLSMSTSAWPDEQQLSVMTGLFRPWDMWKRALLAMLPGGGGSLWAFAGESADGDKPHPLRVGIERTFGGLADAFGLDPLRHVEGAWRETLLAGLARQRAQTEYLLIVAEAWSKGTEHLLHELNELGARGERLESLLAFLRLWAKTFDTAMHEALQSERALAATTKLIRADTRQRQQLQQVVSVVSEALHVPTRDDVDEAYREIQELKREVRQLKKAMQPPVAASKERSVKEREV